MSKREVERLLLSAILGEAEGAVKRLVDFLERCPEWRVSDVEKLLMEEGQQILGGLLSAMMTIRAKESVDDSRCPDCGATMRNKGLSERECQTLIGAVHWWHRYWYCQACRKGHYPLDESLGLSQKRMSEGCLSALGQLAMALPFEQAATLLERLSGVVVTGRHLGRVAEQIGCEIRQQRLQEERPNRW